MEVHSVRCLPSSVSIGPSSLYGGGAGLHSLFGAGVEGPAVAFEDLGDGDFGVVDAAGAAGHARATAGGSHRGDEVNVVGKGGREGGAEEEKSGGDG